MTLLSLQWNENGKTVVDHIALCTPKNKVHLMGQYCETHTPKPAQEFAETDIELDTAWLVKPKIPQGDKM